MRILRPLIIIVGLISVFSFYLTNNIVPAANQRMYDIMFDIREQRQELKFQDGMFFNGLPDMSIRVGHQDDKTQQLTDVLIFDTRAANGDMTTTVADSGYIRLSDDKKYLLVTLFNGETYEQTRNYQWYTKSSLRHHIFDHQEQVIPMTGFDMGRSSSDQFSNSQTKNINQLQDDIDSLELLVSTKFFGNKEMKTGNQLAYHSEYQ